MKFPVTVEWCPRPTCARPFLSRAFPHRAQKGDAAGGRVVCPHCSAAMTRNPDYTYLSAPLLPQEESSFIHGIGKSGALSALSMPDMHWHDSDPVTR